MIKLTPIGTGAPDYWYTVSKAAISTYSPSQRAKYWAMLVDFIPSGTDLNSFGNAIFFTSDLDRAIVKRIDVSMTATELLDVMVVYREAATGGEILNARKFGYGSVIFDFKGGILLKKRDTLVVLIANRGTETHAGFVTVHVVEEV